MERTRIKTIAVLFHPRRSSSGAAGVGVLLLFTAALTSFLLVCEFLYAFSARQSIDDELSRAANTAVDLAMSDAHRQDRLLELDTAIAYERFYEYLYNDMRLSPRLEARSQNNGIIYSIDIDGLTITGSPPSIRFTAIVTLQPAFLSRIAPVPLRFSIRCSSTNRKID